jgi:PBS lyase HEAT-like repeat-containing protein
LPRQPSVPDVLQCPRCGYHPVAEVDLCWACADGIADGPRAARLVAAAESSRDAARILSQVRDPRAVPVLLSALAEGPASSVRKASILAVAAAAPDSFEIVSVILDELEHDDAEVAEAAIDALADTTAQRLLVDEALAGVMVARPELAGKAARALGWRREPRAVPVLKREIAEHGVFVEGNRAATFMLGRCGVAGRSVLRELLATILSAHPDPPEQRWQEPDASVYWLLHGLLGRAAPLDPDGVDVARAVTADHPWAGERLAELMAQLKGEPPPGRPRPQSIDPATRVVPRWAMKFRRVSTPRPGLTTRFGGQPFFPGEPVWPLHPTLSIPLTFLCQIVVPPTVLGDGTWIAHVFVDVSPVDEFVNDPEYPYPVPATAVIVHPGSKWWGSTELRREGPTYAYDRPDDDLDRDRFLYGPQFGFVITEVDLVAGADPIAWPKDFAFEDTDDDWIKVGGTALTLQGGEEQWMAKGWKFLASFSAGRVGHEMGDVAECGVWVHPDGRGVLDVQSH